MLNNTILVESGRKITHSFLIYKTFCKKTTPRVEKNAKPLPHSTSTLTPSQVRRDSAISRLEAPPDEKPTENLRNPSREACRETAPHSVTIPLVFP